MQLYLNFFDEKHYKHNFLLLLLSNLEMKRWQRTEYFDSGYECEIFWSAPSPIRFIRSLPLSAWMTSITSLAKFEICRIVEHTHNPCILLQIISLGAHINSKTQRWPNLQNRAIRTVTNLCIILCSCKCIMYIYYCTVANVCIISQFRNVLKMQNSGYLYKWKLRFGIIID